MTQDSAKERDKFSLPEDLKEVCISDNYFT